MHTKIRKPLWSRDRTVVFGLLWLSWNTWISAETLIMSIHLGVDFHATEYQPDWSVGFSKKNALHGAKNMNNDPTYLVLSFTNSKIHVLFDFIYKTFLRSRCRESVKALSTNLTGYTKAYSERLRSRRVPANERISWHGKRNYLLMVQNSADVHMCDSRHGYLPCTFGGWYR